MAQFQVYLLPGGPLVLDLQCDLIDTGTRVVAPLIPISDGPRPLTRLEPVFGIGGAPHALHTAEMAAVRASSMGQAPVADLRDQDYAIRRALDMVFSGF